MTPLPESDTLAGNDAEAHAISQFKIGIRAIHQNLELSEGPSNPTTPIQKFRNVAMRVIKEKRHARAKLRKKMESMEPALKSLSPVQSSREHTTMIHDINFHYDGRYLVTFSREDDNILFWELDQMEVMVIDRVDMRRHGSSPAQELIGTLSRSRDHMRALRVTSLRENRVLIIGVAALAASASSETGYYKAHQLGSRGHPKPLTLDLEFGLNLLPVSQISRLIPWVGLDYALEDAVLTPDGTKLLGIATLGSTADKNHLKPSRSPPECRIIICDAWEDEIDFEIPTFDPIRRMSLSYSGKRLLVMSDGSTPPRLFRVYPTWLVPLHTFDLPDADGKYPIYGQFGIRSPAPVAGESEEDQIIICANKRGEIFIWHRESYRLLYSLEISIPWGTEVSGVTFGCERLEDYSYLKVAAACTDGTVIMWGSKWDHPNPSVLTDELPRATSETTGGTIEEVIEGADGVVDEDIITEV
ncbi:uncharacterized protein EI90DRAFT_3117624 [Cantharellus anzutake]|uniref:uncharacterized protein n=1 Tax=Cantharellus anzutake TaxID=1750568 RepID=UPI001905AF7A|nr:uncharacterized protein EI90DRAFT_3117624 [Cantharellus anzutake]KAF8339873.1 hypothetical protein EI90DRAFT_3117624 [Cantharellus anzutake]